MHSSCLDEIYKAKCSNIEIEKDNEVIAELNNMTTFTADDLILDDEQTARAKEFTDNLINTSEITCECILQKSYHYYFSTKQERKLNYLMKHGSNKRIRTKNFKRFYGDKIFKINLKGDDMTKFCNHCQDNKETYKSCDNAELQNFTLNSVDIKFNHYEIRCKDCNNKIEDMETTDKIVKTAMREYKLLTNT